MSEGVVVSCSACGEARRVEDPCVDHSWACAGCGAVARVHQGILELDDEAADGDYPPEIYALVADIEERHWWHASRNDVITRALRSHIEPRALRRGVEIGCGTGFVLRHLEQTFGMSVVGVDMHREGLVEARPRTTSALVRTGVARVPLAEPVDLVALCDVIEHVDDDVALLGAARDVLSPDGLVLVTVPARMSLWSLEDVMSGHKRRYTRASLTASLHASGLAPVTLTPFHAAITPLAWIGARRSTVPTPLPEAISFWREALRPPTGLLAACVQRVLSIENAIGARVRLPYASHLLALAERR